MLEALLIWEYVSSKNAWKIVQGVAGLFQDENVLLEEECASVNGSVCCP